MQLTHLPSSHNPAGLSDTHGMHCRAIHCRRRACHGTSDAQGQHDLCRAYCSCSFSDLPMCSRGVLTVLSDGCSIIAPSPAWPAPLACSCSWPLLPLTATKSPPSPPPHLLRVQPVHGDWRQRVKAKGSSKKGDGGSGAAPQPSGPADLEALSVGLPKGWRAMRDKGEVYYGNLDTKVRACST